MQKGLVLFPVFFNIKEFFKNYYYDDDDWKKIANMIYSLASKFQQYPDKLGQWIKEFTSAKSHSRSFQWNKSTYGSARLCYRHLPIYHLTLFEVCLYFP